MSGITQMSVREPGASTVRAIGTTTGIETKGCGRCKLWDEANKKNDEQMGRITNTVMIIFGALITFLASNSEKIKGTIVEKALMETMCGWPLIVPLVGPPIFSMVEDKLYSSLPDTSNSLQQASDQNRTVKKIGIVATILYSLFFIPQYVATQLKNESLGAMISEYSSNGKQAVSIPLAIGFCAGMFSQIFMHMKDNPSFFFKASASGSKMNKEQCAPEMMSQQTSLQNPATTGIEKKECGRCKLLEETNQKSAESIRITKKVGIIATVLSSMIIIPKFMFETYSNKYLQIGGK